jgi:hypothetical protein
LQKDIDLTEGVQRRATKLMVGTKGMSYKERLQFPDMTTLETRRIRGDLIKVFEMLKGIEDVKEERFFTREKGCTRVMNSNYFSLAVTLTVENMRFPMELLICGIICHWMLRYLARCMAFSIRLMLFWIVRGLYKSIMTFFPLPTGLPTFSLPSGYVDLIYVESLDLLDRLGQRMDCVMIVSRIGLAQCHAV